MAIPTASVIANERNTFCFTFIKITVNERIHRVHHSCFYFYCSRICLTTTCISIATKFQVNTHTELTCRKSTIIITMVKNIIDTEVHTGIFIDFLLNNHIPDAVCFTFIHVTSTTVRARVGNLRFTFDFRRLIGSWIDQYFTCICISFISSTRCHVSATARNRVTI